MNKKRVTIKDVAKEAGVSISTVSNALNDVDVLKKETKEHVLKVSEKLGYRPHIAGQILKSGESKNILFISSDVNGPYFSALIASMAETCDKNDYSLNILVTSNTKKIKDMIFGYYADGIIMFNKNILGQKDILEIEQAKIPMVFLDEKIRSSSISSVLFTSYADSKRLTEHLLENSKKILYVQGILQMYDGRERLRGFQDAVNQSKKEVLVEYINGEFDEAQAYNSFLKNFGNKDFDIDTIVCANDQSAIGVMNAMKDLDISLSNVRIVGFDDIEISKYYTPSLSTIRNPIDHLGKKAVEEVQLLIGGEDGSIHELKGKFILRET